VAGRPETTSARAIRGRCAGSVIGAAVVVGNPATACSLSRFKD
jgi:hypothetical protein